MPELLDTNVIVRYFVDAPETIPEPCKGVFAFFEKVEQGIIKVNLPSLVLFQSYFVLTSYYDVPRPEAAEKLEALLAFKGILIAERNVVRDCLRLLQERSLDLVDAYLVAYSRAQGLKGVYSFDKDLESCGLKLLTIG